jgi:hypothetical protein
VAQVNEQESNIILDLDDDAATLTEGIEIKQTANQSGLIDFDTVQI